MSLWVTRTDPDYLALSALTRICVGTIRTWPCTTAEHHGRDLGFLKVRLFLYSFPSFAVDLTILWGVRLLYVPLCASCCCFRGAARSCVICCKLGFGRGVLTYCLLVAGYILDHLQRTAFYAQLLRVMLHAHCCCFGGAARSCVVCCKLGFGRGVLTNRLLVVGYVFDHL